MRRVMELGQRRYVSHLKPLSGWPPVTALIDLLFLTILALGIAALFVRVSGIPVELPESSPIATANIERQYAVVIRHAPDTRKGYILYFKDTPLVGEKAWDELRQKLSGSSRGSVIIYADRAISSEVVAQTMSVCTKAGFMPFWMVAEPGAEAPILVK